jgi:hypothetical protein
LRSGGRSNIRFVIEPDSYSRLKPKFFFAPSLITNRFCSVFKSQIALCGSSLGVELKNAFVLGRGIIYSSGGIVDESLINTRSSKAIAGAFKLFSDLFAFSIDNPMVLDDPLTEYILVKQTWDQNYGHWLIDTLPRVYYSLSMPKSSYKRCFVLGHPSSPLSGLWLQTLQFLGIGEDEVIFTDQRVLYFKRLLYVSPLTTPPGLKHPKILPLYDEIVRKMRSNLKSLESYPGAIYVSRYRVGKRRVINEDELVKMLNHHGIITVYPELLSFSEQVMLFSSSRYIVGAMGAALSNLIFCRPGTSVLVLSNGFMLHDYFYDIACLKGFRYWSYHGNASGMGMDSDFIVDLQEVTPILKSFFKD